VRTDVTAAAVPAGYGPADLRSAYNLTSSALTGQASFSTGCAKRAVADVAAVADPNTGVSAYYNGAWYIFGGTSVSAPIIAACTRSPATRRRSTTTSRTPTRVRSSTSPRAATAAARRQWCQARAGWDGPPVWAPERHRRILIDPSYRACNVMTPRARLLSQATMYQ
jgi:hypothetical protein